MYSTYLLALYGRLFSYKMNKCYPSDIFVDQDSLSEMVCVVCDGIIKQVMMDACGHYFGQACIEEKLAKLSVCPVTGCEIDPQRLAPCLPLNNLIQRLSVRCQESDQCNWMGKCSEWEAHILNDCLFVTVNCVHTHCTFKDKRKSIEKHQNDCHFATVTCNDCKRTLIRAELGDHSGTCEFKKIICPLNCREIIMRRDVNEHLNVTCSMREMECELAPLGCKFRGLQSTLLEHMSNQQTFVSHMNLSFLSFMKMNHQIGDSMSKINERLDRIEQRLNQSGSINNCHQHSSIIQQNRKSSASANNHNLDDNSELSDIKHGMDTIKTGQKGIENKLSKCLFEIDRLSEMQKYSQSLISNINSIRNQPNINQIPIEKTSTTAKTTTSEENTKDRSVFGGLENFRQMAIFSKQSKVLKTNETEEICFDASMSGKMIKVVSTKEIVYEGAGRIALFNSPCLPSRVYKFQFDSLTSEHTGIGFCLRKPISENGFIEPEGAYHGCFLFYSNGEQLIHGREDTVLPLDQKFTFGVGDRLSICFDPIDERLICINLSSNKRAQMKISKNLNLLELYLCVKLCDKGERVKTFSDSNSDTRFMEFDPTQKGSCLDLIAKNEVVSLGDCNIALVKTGLSSLKTFKFQISRLADPYSFAIGAARLSVLKANNFSEKPVEDHGCYLFFANGDQLKNGNAKVFTPHQWIVEFEESDILEIYLDIKAKKLICKNTSNSSVAELDLKVKENADDLYPCVQMGTKGDRVKLI